MRIAFIEPHLLCVGGIRRIVEISNRMLKKGHEVELLTPKGKPCTWMPSQAPTFDMSRLKTETYDVTLFNLAEQYRLCLRSKAKLKVFWVLAAEAEYKNPAVPLAGLQQPGLTYFANSRYVEQYIKKHTRTKQDIPIIPGGINTEHFRHDPTVPKDFDVLYYGSPRPWKGTHLVEGALLGKSVKLLKMHGLNTPQEKMWHLYNRSTLFVSACQVEGFNFPILEAMSCGCPVVCTDDGGSRDFVRNNHNAVVVPRSPQGIWKGVAKLLADKSLRRALKAHGLKTAQHPKFKWQNVVDRFEQSLTKFLE